MLCLSTSMFDVNSVLRAASTTTLSNLLLSTLLTEIVCSCVLNRNTDGILVNANSSISNEIKQGSVRAEFQIMCSIAAADERLCASF